MASKRAAAVQARSRAGLDSASLRQRSSVHTPTPTSRATSSSEALSGGNSRPTARFLKLCPYRANSRPRLCPRVCNSIQATSILTQGGTTPPEGGSSSRVHPAPFVARALMPGRGRRKLPAESFTATQGEFFRLSNPAIPQKKPGTFQSLKAAFTSWRTASVTLMSFASGMPLGLIWIAIPDWMHKSGVDIRVVGLFTLAQAPWSFKFLWSPLMDRFVPPLGRRRGWAAIAQIVLFGGVLLLAGLGNHPAPWAVGAVALVLAFAGATQDIAIDAYAVDVLRPDEQAVAAGARNALWRLGYYLAGGISIGLAGRYGWPAVNLLLACLYLPMP